jgi:hypothetical protein
VFVHAETFPSFSACGRVASSRAEHQNRAEGPRSGPGSAPSVNRAANSLVDSDSALPAPTPNAPIPPPDERALPVAERHISLTA